MALRHMEGPTTLVPHTAVAMWPARHTAVERHTVPARHTAVERHIVPARYIVARRTEVPRTLPRRSAAARHTGLAKHHTQAVRVGRHTVELVVVPVPDSAHKDFDHMVAGFGRVRRIAVLHRNR